jgi:type II secretory pathway pseudopilin PulG
VPLQRGFALIALLALAALICAFLIASTLNLTGAGVSNEREQRSMNALRQAKAALIAYAANEQWQNTGGVTPFQPGALPCPDRDSDGIAEDHEVPQRPCDTPLKRIGRFPWKTIGAEDLRDASGESLWYAVSASFLRNTPSYTNVINSETSGQLAVTGSVSATNVVAILFAPGEAIQGQLRDPANLNDPANYLEQYNNVTYASFTSTGLPSTINNDRLLVITQADLMATVEPIVAANIERDVKPLLAEYFSKWGAYPFAVQFASPPVPQGSYLGTSSPQTTMGLLPATNTATFTWQNPTVTQIIPGGTGTSTVTSWSCSISSLTVTCTVNYNGTSNNDRPDIRLEVFLANASKAFADTPSSATAPGDFAMRDGTGKVPDTHNPMPYGYWSSSGSFEPQMNFVAQLDGGALTYTGRLQNFVSMQGQATITFSLPAPPGYLPRLTNTFPTSPNITWFLSNQWYRQTYYAMSLGYAPGGVLPGNPAACNPPSPTAPPCLTVNNLPAQTNNKQAILVFAGRALDGQNRPSGNPADYLEGQNATPTDLIFEHRSGVPTSINDRVVVVSP